MNSLKGQLLVATPDMNDQRFEQTVIYLVAHGDDGAMGLVINQPMQDVHLSDILHEIDLDDGPVSGPIPADVTTQEVFKGGPVEASRGFVLHSGDYFTPGNSMAVKSGICLTATLDILRAIAQGSGPKHSLLALGYCGWSSGQLEDELRQNGWLTIASSSELVFGVEAGKKYDAALAGLGVTRANLSPDSGTA